MKDGNAVISRMHTYFDTKDPSFKISVTETVFQGNGGPHVNMENGGGDVTDRIRLCSCHPSVSLESEEDKLESLRLTVHKDNSPVKELNFGNCRRNIPPGYEVSLGDKVRVEMNMEIILRGYGKGVYRLELNGIWSFDYLCIPGFAYTFDKKIYFGGNGYLKINWDSNNVINFNSTREDSVTFPFETSAGKTYDITIGIPSFRYSFNGKDWNIFDSKKYYFKDLKSDCVYVKTPNLDGGFLSISVPGSYPLYGHVEDGFNVFDLRKITMAAHCVEDNRFFVYYNWGADKDESERMFPVSINAGYRIGDGQVIIDNRLAGNVAYRLTVDYGDGESVTVPFEGSTADFNEDGVEQLTVRQITVDDSGNEDSKDIRLVPREIDLNLDSSEIKRGVLPKRIGYVYGNYEGEVNPKYFEYMMADERYTEECREDNLDDFFLKNAYGEKMPKLMAKKLYSEIEACILNIQIDSENRHGLIRLFNKYVGVRNDFAEKTLDRFGELHPDDAMLRHMAGYL